MYIIPNYAFDTLTTLHRHCTNIIGQIKKVTWIKRKTKRIENIASNRHQSTKLSSVQVYNLKNRITIVWVSFEFLYNFGTIFWFDLLLCKLVRFISLCLDICLRRFSSISVIFFWSIKWCWYNLGELSLQLTKCQ